MKIRSLIISISLAALAAGVLTAQAPRPRAQGARPKMMEKGMGRMGPGSILSGPNVEQRLTNALALDATQQNAVHTALQEAQVLNQGLPEKAADMRTQLNSAIKANDQGKIDTLSRDMAQISGQQSATTSKTLAKIYAILTPEQKAKLDSAMSRDFRQGNRRAAPKK